MNKHVFFSFGSVAICDGGLVRGIADVTGALTIDLTTPLVKTTGGATSYPVAARSGRGEGELSLTLNQRPPWVDVLLNEGTEAKTDANADAAAGPVTDVKGTTLAAKLTPAIIADKSTFYGLYQLTRTAATKLQGKVVGPKGTIEIPEVTLAANAAKELPGTGVQITASSLAFAEGAVVNFDVLPPHGGISKIEIPQIRVGKQYELVAFSTLGGSDDNLEKLVVPQAVFAGASDKLTDNEPGSNGVEITGTLLAPNDGGPIFRREIIRHV